ncbi:MAG: P63C domain-containing protein [Gemmatimonadetes bacterium]|nr:P63C domain-containing protein [Gemmatimonadota bacterium]
MDDDREQRREAGKKGGKARAKKLTPAQRRDIAVKAAEARWGTELPRATHEGVLAIGEIKIPCAVLEDGTRMLTQSGFMRALGRARQAKGRQYYDADVNMPAFLTAKNLKPFISKDLEVTSSQVEFRTIKGNRAFGYPADILPKVCDVFLDAETSGALARNQLHIAKQALILIRGLAHVGIAALVDEATGYQEIRDRLALQEILDEFLKKEFAAWAKRFPDEFYQQIFRLRGWRWKGMNVNRPQVVAHWTNDLVYARLAPGILRELKKRNPKTEIGRRRSAHHQWLTEDIGHPALAQHLHAVIGLMRAADDWSQFKGLIDKAFARREDHATLPLFKSLSDDDPNEP